MPIRWLCNSHLACISNHANTLLQTMHSIKNVDFPFTFLLMLGKKLSLRDRERSRRVSTRWNAAFLNMPPCIPIPIKSVTVQDEMIAFETSKISRRFHFRNGELCLCVRRINFTYASRTNAFFSTSTIKVRSSIWGNCLEGRMCCQNRHIL